MGYGEGGVTCTETNYFTIAYIRLYFFLKNSNESSEATASRRPADDDGHDDRPEIAWVTRIDLAAAKSESIFVYFYRNRKRISLRQTM